MVGRGVGLRRPEALGEAAGLSLITVIQRLSRPQVSVLAPADSPADELVTRVDGPLFYANAVSIKDRVLATVRSEVVRPKVVVLDLSESPDLDVGSVDMLDELATTLGREGSELRLRNVHARAAAILERSGLADRVPIARPRARRVPK
jgi:MFS superfamily sulfate permease-like transporter